MEKMTWVQYLDAHARGDRNADIARRIGIDASNVTRWRKDGKTPEPQTAVEFAKAYGANPILALAAAGYLEPETIDRHLVIADLSNVTTVDLLDELQHRLTELRGTFETIENSTERDAINEVVTDLANRHLPRNVTPLPNNEEAIDTISDAEVEQITDLGLAALNIPDPTTEQEAPDTP